MQAVTKVTSWAAGWPSSTVVQRVPVTQRHASHRGSYRVRGAGSVHRTSRTASRRHVLPDRRPLALALLHILAVDPSVFHGAAARAGAADFGGCLSSCSSCSDSAGRPPENRHHEFRKPTVQGTYGFANLHRCPWG